MVSHRCKNGVLFIIVLLVVAACGENGEPVVELGPRASDRAVAEPTTPQHSIVFGDHEVHYNAFNSTFLLPEIASLYGISQSENLGVAVLSIYQKDAPGVGVEASVTGGATNLARQRKKLEFDVVREGKAIYHIGTFPISEAEDITFAVDVEIVPTGKTRELKWRQKFWPG